MCARIGSWNTAVPHSEPQGIVKYDAVSRGRCQNPSGPPGLRSVRRPADFRVLDTGRWLWQTDGCDRSRPCFPDPLLAQAATVGPANQELLRFLPRFNAPVRCSGRRRPKFVCRRTPDESSLAEPVTLKHSRKVGLGRTAKHQWRCRSHAGLQVQALERAGGELMVNYRAGTPSPTGERQAHSPTAQTSAIAGGTGNGPLNEAQRNLLTLLELLKEEEE